MCQYCYHYYSSCHHQQTVLLRYCDQAVPASPAPTEKQNRRDKSLWRGRKKKVRRHMQQQVQQEELETPAEHLESSPAPFSFHSAPEHINTSSSPSIGSTITVTDEPYPETSSSIAKQHQKHSSHPSATGDMAGLTPFGGIETLRTWMAGSTSKQVPREYPAASPAVSPTRVRAPGIRMDTDESCELHNSSDILQHLAESSCNLGIEAVGSDAMRHPSYASDYVDRTAKPRDSFDFIEAEVDALKEMVERLKENRERVLAADEPVPRATESQTALSACCPETQAAIAKLSPAERLKLQHALEASDPHKPVMEPQAPALPSTMDFPSLGAAAAGSSTPARDPTPPSRKLSYATAAASSVKATSSHTQSGTRAKRADSKIPAPVMYPAPPRSMEHDLEDDRSVIVSPQVAHAPVMVSHAFPSSPNVKSAKNSPHFAQPTKSFARRASETLRRDSVNVAVKPNADGSPTKSARPGDLDTEKRAQSHKRKSLPDGWANIIATQSDAGKPEVTSATSSSATTFTSPISDGDWQLITSDSASQAANASKAAIQQQSPRLRKKTSTYMSPTAATTQRTIATLSEEPVKRGIPNVRSAAALKLDIERAKHFGSQPSPESIINSSSSGSSCTVEQLAASFRFSPRSPPEVVMQSTEFGHARPLAGHHSSHHSQASQPRSAQPERRQSTRQKPSKKIPASESSRIPQVRRNTVQQTSAAYSPTGKFVASAAHTSSPSFLTSVANTVTRRRTSHADILKPIFDKLDSHGLRKELPDLTAAKTQELRQASAESAARAGREQREREVSAALSDVVLLARQGNAGKRVAVPPHRGPKKEDAASAEAQAESILSALPTLQPVSSAPSQQAADDMAVLRRDRAIDHIIHTTSAAHSRSSSVPVQNSAPSSLRATARTFEPLWKPKSPAEELSLLSWQGSLDTYSDEEWAAMPEEIRRSIMTLRQYKNAGQPGPPGALPSRNRSPSKRAEQRFWGQLLHAPQSDSAASAAEMPGMTSLTSTGGSGEMTSPPSFQAGQMLKRTLSPSKKSVKWTLQETDGQEKPVGFGRAPAPSAELYDHEDTPSISPTSDDTSPVKTPQSARAWTIGAGYATRPYGWKGGDGREISFSGYGPQAEFNAASPVEMEFHARPPFSPVQEQYGPAKRTEYRSPAPKVWPRSQKQWAEYAGYGQMQPCGNMDIVSAIEQLPLGSPMMGLCNDCAPSEVC